jgi:hypothetical protein
VARKPPTEPAEIARPIVHLEALRARATWAVAAAGCTEPQAA